MIIWACTLCYAKVAWNLQQDATEKLEQGLRGEARDTHQGESGMLPGVGSVPGGGWDTSQRVRGHLQADANEDPHRSQLLEERLSSHTDGGAVKGTLRGLTRESILPSSMSAISCRMPSSASQNRSISALSSDSVGSIIKVPVTGHDMVGAWKPG